MERAQALDVATASRLQGDVLGDHVHDRGALADECDVLVPDPPGHVTPSEVVGFYPA